MLLYFHVSTTGKLLHVVDELFFTFQCHFEIATQFLQCLVTFLSTIEKNDSTRLSHEELVGVKCR